MGRRSCLRNTVSRITLLNRDGTVKQVFHLTEKGKLTVTPKMVAAKKAADPAPPVSFVIPSPPEATPHASVSFADMFDQMEIMCSSWDMSMTGEDQAPSLGLSEGLAGKMDIDPPFGFEF